MKKVLSLAIMLVLLSASGVSAQFHDWDGNLEAQWQPPTWGNPLDHYILSYEINTIPDSVTTTTITEYDDSAVLTNLGDWAILSIKAVSIIDDTSTVAYSDTAYYYLETGIGPPNFIEWIQGSLLRPILPTTE